ncbi:MAG: rhodanese-like domain-containing protein [Gammaproteobacteria bacterium]|jgi:rhodanese-related sulfurtransferase|nr:rhodanese-like domain-containing protein [Gammaproteobacteria bacterium]MDH3933849.1 rhodanese-like domain-containing protein [Gammaproteobacteria bacterium]MDH3987339.1 rhodanese-like domain-containing protein [Gammaproteobacteria bacterium]
MKRFTDLIADTLVDISEQFPWDIEEKINSSELRPLLLDIREADEFAAMHIQESLHVPRGILESACEYDYEETVRELVEAREREVVVICRSGNRSALAAYTMQLMGYQQVCSMKTGLRGWNDYELPLVDASGHTIPVDVADDFFTTRLRADQMSPKS